MKVYRQKRRSCASCKPHKVGWAPMWNNKILAKLKRMDKEVRDYKREA